MSPSPSRSAVPRRSCPSARRPAGRTIRNYRQLFFMNRSRSILISAFAGLLAFAASALGQTRTIVIDAGQRLKRILQAEGYRVIMTRDSDVFIPLGTRVAIANSYRGANFVSIHFNCASRVGANGIETYYYSSDSASLAASIHRNVVSGAPSENRGIRRRGFYVLRRTSIPAVLVECGFLTNPTEGRLALTGDYRQRLAEQIARGIRRQPAPYVRALTPSLRSVSLGNDFVRVPAESFSRSRKRSSKSARTHRSSKNRKSESSTPRKKKKKKSSEE